MRAGADVAWLTGAVSSRHVVVDGSNLATEGRTTPSLAQLEEAVAEMRRELGEAEVTVVVDASFAHRIAEAEWPRFEELVAAGELVSPPAGAVGRGDAFLLRIAEKVDGIVLSNDSFQEFHGAHPWLFAHGRLLGATKVPGVGWIFVARNPVRGRRSQVALREATRAKQQVEKAIAAATKEVVKPAPPRAGEGTPAAKAAVPRAANDPTTFISFIADHPLGGEIEAEVETFSSHGAVVRSGELRAYVPLSGLGDPAPRRARDLLHKGETRRFVITALDPYRRGVELALPGVGVVSGRPSEETVAAVVKMARTGPAKPAAPRGAALKRRAAKRPAAKFAPPKVPRQPAARAGRRRAGVTGSSPPAARRVTPPKMAAAKQVAPPVTGPRRSPRATAGLAGSSPTPSGPPAGSPPTRSAGAASRAMGASKPRGSAKRPRSR
ncbi:MAG: hypothetical protein ABSC73_01135 [Acidimicrobiales bacterium]